MKKTILVSALTALITVILAFLVIHLICDDCYEDDDDYCESRHQKVHMMGHGGHDCTEFTWTGDHPMMDEEMMARFKDVRAEFDNKLSAEEKETIARVKDSFKKLKENEEIEDDDQAMEDHMADFEAIEAIAENHNESLDAIMAKSHEGKTKAKEAECKKKCEGEAKTAECKKKCEGKDVKVEKRVEVIIIKEGEGEEQKVMMFGGDHANTFRVHFLLMDF
ncbi:MAG: hypothetical protein U9R60_06210 [Bacteroidota bacterium]|nr:hypothetical protein [Bacteroidota bacterium]